MAKFTKCLVSKCDRQAKSRGLCYSCYANARVLMKSGEAKEEDLIRKGLISVKLIKKGTNLFKEEFQTLSKSRWS